MCVCAEGEVGDDGRNGVYKSKIKERDKRGTARWRRRV